MTGVSFLLTVYNKARYLPAVLDAIRRQDGPFARELIVVDDGSTDGSRELLRARLADWPDAVLVEQANAGPSVATNAALARARHPWVKPVDGDDLLQPWATARLLAAATALGTRFAYGRSSLYRLGDPEALGRAPDGRPPRRIDAPLPMLIEKALFNPSAMLIETALFRAVGGCDERVFIQDYAFVLHAARHGAFAALDEAVALSPEEDVAGRLNAGPQPLHDANLALACFLEAAPDLPRPLRRLAFRRAAGRAWKWALRHRRGRFGLHPAFWLSALSYLPVPVDEPRLVRRSCEAFRPDPRLRLVGAGDG